MLAPPTDKSVLELVAPEFVQDFGIVVFALLAAYLISAVLTAGAVRLAARAETGLHEALVAELRPALFFALVGLGVWTFLEVLHLPEHVESLVVSLLGSAVALFSGQRLLRAALHFIRAMGQSTRPGRRLPARYVPLAQYAAHLGVWFAVLYAVAFAWKLPGTLLNSWAGMVGLALGLAAEASFRHMIASVFIAADRPCRLGDFLVLSGGDRGRVTHLGLRSVRLLTLDGVELNVPNALLADSRVVNESGGDSPELRIRTTFALEVGVDLAGVRRLVDEMPELPGLAPGRRPEFQVLLLDRWAVRVAVWFWVAEPAFRLPATDAVNTWLYKRLFAAGVPLARRQHEVRIDDLPATWPLLGHPSGSFEVRAP